MTGSCFQSLHQIRAVRHSITFDMAKTLVCSLVNLRIDYCNLIFSGLPAYSIAHLQSVLNAGTWVVHQHRHYDHIAYVLRDELHWLPAVQRVHFNLCITVYASSCLCTSPTSVVLTSIRSGHCLHSADDGTLKVSRTRIELSKSVYRLCP